ncbi:hypothetical protein Q5752_000922 [Cryptotrichosporon argae]
MPLLLASLAFAVSLSLLPYAPPAADDEPGDLGLPDSASTSKGTPLPASIPAHSGLHSAASSPVSSSAPSPRLASPSRETQPHWAWRPAARRASLNDAHARPHANALGFVHPDTRPAFAMHQRCLSTSALP